MMNINGFEKLSMVDYPGEIAATVFTSGCNFRCPFCHNGGLVEFQEGTISETEVLSYLNKRKNMLTGVCISGGEPTLQPDLEKFICKIKNIGLKVKLDTNGTTPQILKDLISKGLLDYVAMDVKNSLKEYPQTAGVSELNTSNILESIKILKENIVPYEFRTTLIEGHHTYESMIDMGAMLEGAEKLVLQKFVFRQSCLGRKLKEIPLSKAEEFMEILKEFVKNVTTRGYV